MNTQSVLNAIRQMDNDDLNEVLRAVKDQRNWLARSTARSLTVGDRVRFDAGRRGFILGEVTKVNPKNILVRQDGAFTTWRVQASLLEKI